MVTKYDVNVAVHFALDYGFIIIGNRMILQFC
ncbi:hypothetical protein BH20BAC1_BH20BAC1_11710 [soil metagenome]